MRQAVRDVGLDRDQRRFESPECARRDARHGPSGRGIDGHDGAASIGWRGRGMGPPSGTAVPERDYCGVSEATRQAADRRRASAEDYGATSWRIAALFFGVGILSRLPFLAANLWAHDSVLYARAIEHFDPLDQRPQAPGYLYYVLLLRALNAVTGDPNRAMTIVSLVAGAAAVALLYLLAARMYDERTARDRIGGLRDRRRVPHRPRDLPRAALAARRLGRAAPLVGRRRGAGERPRRRVVLRDRGARRRRGGAPRRARRAGPLHRRALQRLWERTASDRHQRLRAGALPRPRDVLPDPGGGRPGALERCAAHRATRPPP